METILPGVTPTFLYPKVNQFGVDRVCALIVLALENRNWDVPGITVKFSVYGTGEEKYRKVWEIRGENFRLHFGRKQETLPGGTWNDTAAVTDIVIPKIEISIHEDESGPSAWYYVGDNWEQDRDWFLTGSKVHSKMNNEPRRYLQYTGSCFKPGEGDGSYIPGRRKPYMVHTNDCGREYELKRGEKAYFKTDVLLHEISNWLWKNVLDEIKKHPEAERKIGFVHEPLITGVEFPPIYTVCERHEAVRFTKGKWDANSLEPKDRYGLIGNGWRLVNLGTSNDGTFPGVAYEGFLWCFVGSSAVLITQDEIQIDHMKGDFLVRITPKYANHIYVADVGAQIEWKKKFFEAHPEQERLTDSELHEYYRVTARTLVPIGDYKGGYMQPVVLIARELGLDEVEPVANVQDLPKREQTTA